MTLQNQNWPHHTIIPVIALCFVINEKVCLSFSILSLHNFTSSWSSQVFRLLASLLRLVIILCIFKLRSVSFVLVDIETCLVSNLYSSSIRFRSFFWRTLRMFLWCSSDVLRCWRTQSWSSWYNFIPYLKWRDIDCDYQVSGIVSLPGWNYTVILESTSSSSSASVLPELFELLAANPTGHMVTTHDSASSSSNSRPRVPCNQQFKLLSWRQTPMLATLKPRFQRHVRPQVGATCRFQTYILTMIK